MQPDSHLHLVCRHEMTFRNTLVSKEGKCWMVFLMGLSVAKRPTGDLIYRGRTWQNELMRELCVHVCACVPTAWEGCLRKVHPILLLQEKSPYSCKIIATSLKIGHLNTATQETRPLKGDLRRMADLAWDEKKSPQSRNKAGQDNFERPEKCFHYIRNYQNSS